MHNVDCAPNVTAERAGHILDGNVNRFGNGSGGHRRNSDNINVVEETKGPDANGVTEGRIQVRDPATGRFVNKPAKTTFFPSHWTRRQTLREVQGAFNNKRDLGNGRWEGTSPSGVPVRGRVDDAGNITSAFPVHGA